MAKSKPRIVKTAKEVADHFEVSKQAVSQWKKRVDPMPGKSGHYDLDEIEAWHDSTFLKGKPGDSNNELMKEMLLAKIRKETALADQNEIKAKRMDEDYIPISDVLEWVTEFLTLQRKLITAMPVEMFADAPDEIRKIYQPDLKARMDIHLNQMADWIERVEDQRG